MSNTMEVSTRTQAAGLAAFQESRELSEIKGKMYLARQFPRDENVALARVLNECQRKELAENACYEFPRGDSVVKGPSIRLVEVLARHWGNIDYGVTEVESSDTETTVKSFAWDLETNVSDQKVFTVKHVRTTKKCVFKLSDERDIYEMVANKAARRKRACMLAVLPGWYVDEAVAACEKALADAMGKEGKIEDLRPKMVAAFAEFGVTPEQISAKLSKEVDKLSMQDIIKLRNLYSAIKDGFVKPADAFGLEGGDRPADLPSEEEDAGLDALNDLIGGSKNGAHEG